MFTSEQVNALMKSAIERGLITFGEQVAPDTWAIRIASGEKILGLSNNKAGVVASALILGRRIGRKQAEKRAAEAAKERHAKFSLN